MHKIEPYHPEIRVFDRQHNLVAVYYDIFECATYIWKDLPGVGWYQFENSIVDNFEDRDFWLDSWGPTRRAQYIIRTEFNEIVTRDQLQDLRPAYKRKQWTRRGSGYGTYRKICTTQERRQYYAALDQDTDVPVKLRARRNPRNLPNAWDDKYFYKGRGWKNFRKTQYKS